MHSNFAFIRLTLQIYKGTLVMATPAAEYLENFSVFKFAYNFA